MATQGAWEHPLLWMQTSPFLELTFEWFKDGTVIAGETNSTLDVSTDGTYSFNATLNDGCESTDEVIIEFTTPPEITTPPEDILLCETDGNGREEFDFSSNEALVLGSQAAANFQLATIQVRRMQR